LDTESQGASEDWPDIRLQPLLYPGCTDSVATKRGSQTRNALS